MEINVTRLQYLKMLGTVINLKNKEIEILDCMLNNNTTDRNEIATILDMDVRVVSNYKTSLVNKKVIIDDKVNGMVTLNKLQLNVSNKE